MDRQLQEYFENTYDLDETLFSGITGLRVTLLAASRSIET
jgi:hypothetical protein